MNFFNRAKASIIRRPGKTIILLLLVFILGSVIAGAISVEGAISNTDANLRRNMRPIVSIEFDDMRFHDNIDWDNHDWETMPDPWLTRPRITADIVRSIGRLPYVNFYDFVMNYSAESFELERYTGGGMMGWGSDPWRPNWLNIRGTSSTSMVQIDQGVIDLVQGNQFTDMHMNPGSEVVGALISMQFAEVNNLTLGSTFTVYSFIHTVDEHGDIWCWIGPECFDEDDRLYTSVPLVLEVIGLFDVPDSDDQDTWTRIETLNNIFIPNWAIEDHTLRTRLATVSAFEAAGQEMPSWMQHQQDDENPHDIIPLFILDNPLELEEFRTTAQALLPSEYHSILDMSNAFDEISSSMETMQTIANWILYVSIGATLLILSLLITLFLRDRRYEMGVYLALGEKKGNVVSQILLEVVLTSLVAITLSVFVGHFISGQISSNMLENHLLADNNNDDMFGMMRWDVFQQIGIPNNEMSVSEMMDAFDVSLSVQTIGMFYVIGLSAVILSTVAPVIYVVRLKPKKVLM